jgi:uncharacterized protein YaaR (DUF327 family)
MFNQNLQNSLNAVQAKQQEDRQWKENVLAVLKSIDDKLEKLVN